MFATSKPAVAEEHGLVPTDDEEWEPTPLTFTVGRGEVPTSLTASTP